MAIKVIKNYIFFKDLRDREYEPAHKQGKGWWEREEILK